MNDLVENLKVVFHDHLTKVDWMTEATRAKALAKFEPLHAQIGYPDKFRDYSSVKITRDIISATFAGRRPLTNIARSPASARPWTVASGT